MFWCSSLQFALSMCVLYVPSDIINVSAFYYMCWMSALLSALTWIITGKIKRVQQVEITGLKNKARIILISVFDVVFCFVCVCIWFFVLLIFLLFILICGFTMMILRVQTTSEHLIVTLPYIATVPLFWSCCLWWMTDFH